MFILPFYSEMTVFIVGYEMSIFAVRHNSLVLAASLQWWAGASGNLLAFVGCPCARTHVNWGCEDFQALLCLVEQYFRAERE